MCSYTEKGIYFKELARVIVGAGKSEISRVSWRPTIELMLQLESKGSPEAELPLPQTPQSFLVRPSTDWVRPTHIRKGNLLYPNLLI